MHSSKLFSALRCLTPKQIKMLGELTRSPFFNKDQELEAFYDLLAECAPKFTHKRLERSMCYDLLFPGEPLNEKKLSYLMSNMLKLIEQLIVQESIKKQPSYAHQQLLQTYLEWGLDKHYKGVLKDAHQVLNKSEQRDADYYFNAFQLEAINNLYFDKQRKHVFDESLQKAVDMLDIYYLTVKLKYSCEIYNRKNVVSADYELKMLDEIQAYIAKHDFSSSPSVVVYYQILKTLQESDEEQHFKKLKELITGQIESFPIKEARDIYAYAQNYCIKKINRGNREYLTELFELYQTAIAQEIIFEGRYLSPWTFKNVVVVGLRVQEFDWVENFIKLYRERLSPKFRDNIYNLNMAMLMFYREQFEDALAQLHNIEFTDIVYALETKNLQLRLYYELNEIEPLFSLIDAFKAYLRRNKLISAYQKTVHLNLLKYVKKLFKIPPRDRSKLLKFKEEITSTKQIASIDWLNQKVDQKLKPN